jgi:hypothetical protein
MQELRILVAQDPAGRPVSARWVKRGTRRCRRPSEKGDEGGNNEEKQRLTYLLRALLLSKHFVLLCDNLCLVLKDEGER